MITSLKSNLIEKLIDSTLNFIKLHHLLFSFMLFCFMFFIIMALMVFDYHLIMTKREKISLLCY